MVINKQQYWLDDHGVTSTTAPTSDGGIRYDGCLEGKILGFPLLHDMGHFKIRSVARSGELGLTLVVYYSITSGRGHFSKH